LVATARFHSRMATLRFHCQPNCLRGTWRRSRCGEVAEWALRFDDGRVNVSVAGKELTFVDGDSLPTENFYVTLERFKRLTGLKELSLAKASITDAGPENLKGLKSLTKLTLFDCPEITDAGLEHIKGLTNLTELNVNHCDKITDAGLVHLKGLTSLTKLWLWECSNLTDTGLEHVKGLTNLTHLDLRGCVEITDAGLEHLNGLTKLEALVLIRCPKITDVGINKLKQSIPDCDIRH
jgi:hypothetical protein